MYASVNAQLCGGSLGDPVVKIDFGSGSNPQGPPLSGNKTNYIYQAADCPNDGLYTIRSNTNNCFGNAWFQISQDHTGNPGGYMMIVNASYDPGDFYVDTVKGLCPGTTYEFASWVMNLIKSNPQAILPDITFSIETTTGNVLQSFSTGKIPFLGTPTWKQYGFYFATPSGITTVVIRMKNNAPGGIGNDILLDDITFRPCGPLVSLVVNGIPKDTTEFCDTDTRVLNFSGTLNPASPTASYQWQVNTNNTTWNDIAGAQTNNYSRYPTTAGNYSYRLLTAEGSNINIAACRIASNAVNVFVDAPPTIAIQSNNPSCFGDTISLSATGADAFKWNGPNGFTNNTSSFKIYPTAAINNGIYNVTGTTTIGCVNTNSININLGSVPQPNAGNDTIICEGTTAFLHATGGTSYNWKPASTLDNPNISNPSATPIDTIQYIVTVSNNSCSRNDTVIVNVLKKPVAQVGPKQTIFEGNYTQLSGVIDGTNVSFYWSPNQDISDIHSLSPTVNPANSIYYILNVVSNDGCGTAKDSTFIRVLKKIKPPNAFTPNGDGINDDWYIKDLETYAEAEVFIYSRTGQLIFQSKGYNKRWNGTFNNQPLPVGTYYYIIDLKNNIPKISGSVTIIR